MTGRRWVEVHGMKSPLLEVFREWGWKWQPALCRCQWACTLDQDTLTKKGKR